MSEVLTDPARTPAIEGLVERIRAERSYGPDNGRFVELWTEDRDALCTALTEQAAMIAERDAEIVRLREALHKIANARPIGGRCNSNATCNVMEGIAIHALVEPSRGDTALAIGKPEC